VKKPDVATFRSEPLNVLYCQKKVRALEETGTIIIHGLHDISGF
jgi:hypothetical protein